MRRSISTLSVLAALVGPAAGAPASTIKDLFGQLNRCLSGSLPQAGTDVTLQFMLNRKGALIGKPRLTHAVWPPGADPRETGAAVAADFNRCLPLDITDGLGGAIAGRLLVYRLHTATRGEPA